jgi:CRP-like cAMP-binding protein
MALVDRTPRLASAMAESNVKLLAINRAAFLNLVKHSRRFAASLLSAVSARARYAASR